MKNQPLAEVFGFPPANVSHQAERYRLKMNFDSQRLSDGKVILIIDDISREVKQYLIDMKVQSISKHDVLKLADQFDDMEDREKVLRIVHEEFRREYESRVK